MRILFFIESLRSGGKERRLVELIKGLKKYPDIEMELVLTREEIHYTEIFDTGIKIHYTIRKGLKKDPRLFWKFYKIAKRFKPDIIHVWGNMVAIYAIPAKVLMRIPMVNSSITYALKVRKFSKFNFESKFTFIFSNRIIANSLAGLESHNYSVSEKHRVIYNGYDIKRNKFNKVDLKKELGLPVDAYLIGMIASFTDAKDYQTYIEVAKSFKNKYNNMFFLAIGDGPNLQKCKTKVKKQNVSNFLFLGKRNDIENICSNLNIGILLTNTKGHAEGISNTILEYMASKIPVIATNAGGTTELIKENISGFLVPPFDSQTIVKKIIEVKNNKSLANKVGENGREIILKKFTIDKMIDEYINVYKEIIYD